MGIGNTLTRVIASALLALASGAALAQECRGDSVHLRGPTGEAVFHVELADTPQERAQGLMHRESLARSAGMLFVYPAPQQVGF